MLEEMKLHSLVQKIQECLELVSPDSREQLATPMITEDSSKQIVPVASYSFSNFALKPLKTVEDLAMDVKGIILYPCTYNNISIYCYIICYSHADEFATLKEDLLNQYLQFEENILTTVDDFKSKQLDYLKRELMSTTGNLHFYNIIEVHAIM